MHEATRKKERRQFGRRSTVWHAWVLLNGRPRVTCIVRNFSVGGALLEFLDSPPPVQNFKLAIEHLDFKTHCDVRHRNGTAVGVYFPHEVRDFDTKGCSHSSRIAGDIRPAPGMGT
jgi:hypothetical protein